MTCIVRVLLFFVPIAWITLSGPLLGAVLLLAAGGAVAEVIRLRRIHDLVTAWPMAVLVGLWCAWSFLSAVPGHDDLLPPRDVALCFIFATAAGICIREYSRRSQTGTLVALQAAVLLLTAIGMVIGFSEQAGAATATASERIKTFPWPRALPEASAEALPRWRGFNLQYKFHLDESNIRIHAGDGGVVERDFRMIAELGFNSVRLPLDYRIWTLAGRKQGQATRPPS
ncbi:MAG: hypothetical protein ACREIA_19110 [Opitutaceae bacterium]